MTRHEPVMGAPVTPGSLPPDSDPDRHQTVTERAIDLDDQVTVGATTAGDLCRALAEAEARAEMLRRQVEGLAAGDPPGPVPDLPPLPPTGPVWWGDVIPYPPDGVVTCDILAARATAQALAHHQAWMPAAAAYLADVSPEAATRLAAARARHLEVAHAAYIAAAALRGLPAPVIADAVDHSTCWHHLEYWAAGYLDLTPTEVTELVARLTVDQPDRGDDR